MFIGIGSGFCVEHFDGSPINLVTLYRAIKAEREKTRSTSEHINRLMTSSFSPDNTSQLICAVSELCQHADAFMLVVDASTGPSEPKGVVIIAYQLYVVLQVPKMGVY